MVRTVIRTALLAAGAALLAGCASQSGPGAASASPSTRPATSVGPSRPATLSPQQTARADVSAMAKAFVAPPGARRLAGAPTGSANLLPPFSFGDKNDVVTTGWWSYSGTLDQAVGWFMSHVPPGTTRTGTGTMNSIPFVTFGRPATALLQSRELDVQVAVHDGSTLLRVDAQDTWRPAHPAAAVIPAEVTRLVVIASPGSNPSKALPGQRTLATVTDPTLVAKTVALVNALPTAPVGVFNCPNDDGAELTLDFYQGHGDTDGTSPAAVVVDRMGGCGGTLLSVRGGPQGVALADSSQQILSLLKLTFPGRAG
ncbi:hypothetical protein ABUW04_22015 [Streptacidiphilus sp. N1-10]|uniref:Uncharacterized protein n=1 Tax=Streptacidiphilus jeojiensis TaxID=3229225 RepID=A0ABV6XRT6_9ACTN